jgi:hypothetical protein
VITGHYNFDKAVLSKSLGQLHPKIDSLEEKKSLGVYRCKKSQGYFFTVQDPKLAPPEMPDRRANDSEWIKLCEMDKTFLASYERKVIKEKTYGHANKKHKVSDEVRRRRQKNWK